MVVPYETELIIMKVVTIALGGVFLWYAGRAYLKTRSRQMMVLLLAVALLTVSSVSEGIAYQGGSGLPLEISHVLEGAVTLVAFAVLVASLFVRQRGGGKVKGSGKDEGP